MMYDFHLASILPQVFNSGSTAPLPRIFEMIGRYEIPATSIRFSLHGMSAFDLIMIFILMFGGLGLFLSSLRNLDER